MGVDFTIRLDEGPGAGLPQAPPGNQPPGNQPPGPGQPAPPPGSLAPLTPAEHQQLLDNIRSASEKMGKAADAFSAPPAPAAEAATSQQLRFLDLLAQQAAQGKAPGPAGVPPGAPPAVPPLTAVPIPPRPSGAPAGPAGVRAMAEVEVAGPGEVMLEELRKAHEAARAGKDAERFRDMKKDMPDLTEEFRRDVAEREAQRRLAYTIDPSRARLGETIAGGLSPGQGGEAVEGAAAIAPQVAMVKAISEELGKQFTQTAKEVEFFGEQVARTASNDYLGAFRAQIDHTTEGLKDVPLVGGALAGGFRFVLSPLTAFTDNVVAFNQRARELSGLSGPLAYAQAGNEVRNLMADLREAEVLGPGLAELSSTTNEAWHEIREMLLPIKAFVVEVLNVLMADAVAILRDDIQPFVARALEWFDKVLSGLQYIAAIFSERAELAINELRNELGRAIRAGRLDPDAGLDPMSRLRDVFLAAPAVLPAGALPPGELPWGPRP